jgi:hypothetical protein
MSTRRQLIQGLGIGLVAGSAATPALARRAHVRRAAWATDLPPWWLISPLTAGQQVGPTWSVGNLEVVREGAAVLTLVTGDERQARVHICAHEGRPRGLVHTALFDLVLMDGGQGDRPTDESLGRVLMQLGRHIRRNEIRSDDAQIGSVTGLLSHDERVALFGPEHLT